MKTLLTIGIFLYSIASYSQTWTKKLSQSPIPDARSTGVAFSNSNFGFIGMGRDASNSEFKDFWKFDPVSGNWTQLADFPGTSRKNSFVFVIDSFAYIGSGYDNGILRTDFYRYNMNNDTWDTLANYPSTGRRNPFAASANGKGYVGGGYDGANAVDEFYEYDPISNTWTTLPNLPFGDRTGGVSFALNDTIYFGLGTDVVSSYNDIWAYNVVDSSWTQKASMLGIPRYNSSIVQVGGKYLVGGGTTLNTSATLSDFYLYDPLTNQWSNASTPLGSRASSFCFSIGSYGYIFSGANYLPDLLQVKSQSNNLYWNEIVGISNRDASVGFSNGTYGFIGLGGKSDPAYYKDCWKYDPMQNSIGRVSDFPGIGRKGAIAFSIDSFAYVGAGVSPGFNFQSDMYRYNMNSDIWDTLSNFPGQGKRKSFVATKNGKAYVGGGLTFSGSTSNVFNDFFEYDPQNDNWRSLPNLPFGNRSTGISFVIEDTIYFGLGYDGSNDYNDLWAYSVNDSSWSQKATMLGVPRLEAVAIVVDGKAIVGGGFRANSTSQILLDYYEYNPQTNQWTSITVPADMQRARVASFTLNNSTYLFGGFGPNQNFLGDLWEIQGVITSIEEVADDQSLKIYPNPSMGQLFIENSIPIEQIRIFDTNGRIVEERVFQSSQAKISMDLDLPKGIYFIDIRSKEKSMTKKLIIN